VITFKKLAFRWRTKTANGIAVDAVIDSVSIATTFKEQLAEQALFLLYY
jgi:Fe-S cluster assembly protein SufB